MNSKTDDQAFIRKHNLGLTSNVQKSRTKIQRLDGHSHFLYDLRHHLSMACYLSDNLLPTAPSTLWHATTCGKVQSLRNLFHKAKREWKRCYNGSWDTALTVWNVCLLAGNIKRGRTHHLRLLSPLPQWCDSVLLFPAWCWGSVFPSSNPPHVAKASQNPQNSYQHSP